MKKLFVLSGLFLFVLLGVALVSPAVADTKWNLTNGILYDGGTVTGWFNVSASTGLIIDWNIVASQPSDTVEVPPPFTFNPSNSTAFEVYEPPGNIGNTSEFTIIAINSLEEVYFPTTGTEANLASMQLYISKPLSSPVSVNTILPLLPEPPANEYGWYAGFQPPYGIFDGYVTFVTSGQLIAVEAVTIDIEPWFKHNAIDPRFKWVTIPVAILSTPSLNAPKSVVLDSLTFGHTGNENSLAFCSPLSFDVNGDKARDLICFFYTGQAGFQCGDTQGILKGQTKDGTPIEGSDSVMIIRYK